MNKIIEWLLEGDISIQYLTHKLILKSDSSVLLDLQNRIPLEGVGRELLSRRTDSGHWGIHYYQKKWTSTHYTLLDLMNMGIPNTVPACCEMVERMFRECLSPRGGINLAKSDLDSDIAVEGMALNYAAYFSPANPQLIPVVSHLIRSQKKDGGFSWNPQTENGDPHTTICVLEGLHQFEVSCTNHDPINVKDAKNKAIEYLLSNHLFFEDRDTRFRKLSYPYRYRYDLLRVLEYFALEKVPYDERMFNALEWLKKKQHKDGLWYLENVHKGNQHIIMEEIGKPSRFITLKALFIGQFYNTL